MSFQTSPGIRAREIDLTSSTPAVSTSIGAFCGAFNWGPAEEIVTVSGEQQLADMFGKPDDETAQYFFPAAQFLKYGNTLKVVRAATGNRNANSSGDGRQIRNDSDFESKKGLFVSNEVSIEYDRGILVNESSVSDTDTTLDFDGNVDFTASVNQSLLKELKKLNSSVTYTNFASAVTNSIFNDGTWFLSIYEGTGNNLTSPKTSEVTDIPIESISGTTITLKGQLGADAAGDIADNDRIAITRKSEFCVARYPGELGNSLKIDICPAGTAFNTWAYASQFDAVPGTSDHAERIVDSSANDEVHVVVVDQDGLWSGTKGLVLEKWDYLSQASDAKNEDNATNYFVDVINNQSRFVRISPISIVDDSIQPNMHEKLQKDRHYSSSGAGVMEFSLSGGTDDNTPTIGELQNGYNLFKDRETEDVNLILGGPAVLNTGGTETDFGDYNTMANWLIDLADGENAAARGRQDCLVWLSPPISATVNTTGQATKVKTWADSLKSTTYAALDSAAVYVYDKYNDTYRWIPANGDTNGTCAYTDLVADAWFSPAGYQRGRLRGVTKIAWNPNGSERDTLFKARVNPIVSFPGSGIMLFGDRTATRKPSDLDAISVRRLFNVVKTAIGRSANSQLFEQNDDFTRAQFRSQTEPLLREIQGRRGIEQFIVKCDEENNDDDVRNAKRFVADIAIAAVKPIRFITLNFIATRSGIQFSEILG